VKKSTETVLCRLGVASFRNLVDAQVEWSDGLNVISGENGQGKTNVLEACFFLAMGRSFRTSRVDSMARRGESKFSLSGQVRHRQVHHELIVHAGRGLRQRQLDGRQADLGESLEVLACMVFASPRLSLFRGGPDDRRRFLDRGIVGIRPEMVKVYRDYLRALRQKNQLLRQARNGGSVAALRQQLEAFNSHLIGAAQQIRRARHDYVKKLGEILQQDAGPGDLVPGGHPEMEYRPHPDLETDLASAYAERLDDELRRGHALVGPQRDDLSIHMTAGEMNRFASAGQQRAALIALKMAKMLVHKELAGSYPVLLVDDVDAELDAVRTRRALDLLDGPYQVLLASAAASTWAGEGRVARHFSVQDGIISRSS
jgi:DNA replication and repair protein RecF